MKKWLIVLFMPILMHGQNNIFFQEAQTAVNKQQYALGINKGLDGIKDSLSRISQRTVSVLPYINSAKSTNVNYSIDLYNKNTLFNLEIEYSIPSQGTLDIGLHYAFESVRYYYTYIEASKNYMFPHVDYEVITLNDKNISFLWHKKENRAYYVHTFNHKQYKELSGVPGLLLQVSFTTPQQINRKELIISDLVCKIDWSTLQTLFGSI